MGKTKTQDFCTKQNIVQTKTYKSKSEKYSIQISTYSTGPNTWKYSSGTIYDGDRKIDTVYRNYGSFPYEIVENHPNGHAYLICGQNYMGQTVIQLDTGVRKDSNVQREQFCWASIQASPDSTKLMVAGCWWGAPYQLCIFDFSDPMSLSFERLAEAEHFNTDKEQWVSDTLINYEYQKSYDEGDEQIENMTLTQKQTKQMQKYKYKCFERDINVTWEPFKESK